MRCSQCNRDESDCMCPAGARARSGRPASGQGSLFDQPEGFRRKELGMTLAAEAERRVEILRLGRASCRLAASMRDSREATADDAHAGLERTLPGYESEWLGNAAGSLFRGKEWINTGRYVMSTRTTNNARRMAVWRLDLTLI